MSVDNNERLVEGLDRIRLESLNRVDNATANLIRAVETEFPAEAVEERLDSMQPSGPVGPASEDMGGLRARIELLHRDDGSKAA